MATNRYFCEKKTVKGKLYLVPNLLGDGPAEDVIPQNVLTIIRNLQYFIVEDVRTARRFLSKIHTNHKIDDITFYLLNEHTQVAEIAKYLDPIENFDMGVLSEAGVPGVADPGSDIVRIAHRRRIEVVPLVGPSSILMAVMASGLNGQNFAFNGYLPVKHPERVARIKVLEKKVYSESQTQLFIETPYRNLQLLEDILATCKPETLLGIACNITDPGAILRTLSIEEWRKQIPDIHKKPAIFSLGK